MPSERTEPAPASLPSPGSPALIDGLYQGTQLIRTGVLSGGCFLNDGRVPEGTTAELVPHSPSPALSTPLNLI